jgi:NADPH:quinone reductase-like Zn-dependent oxidoreductase
MLSGQFKIPLQHIFDQKEGSFANALLKATNGKGADVVLNSVTGELLHATWTCVADFGRMIEIGKKDLLGAAKLDMEGFLGNKTFSHVDLDRLRVAKPAVVSK